MKPVFACILLLSAVLFAGYASAADSTITKKTLFLSVAAGINSNTVFGSMVDRNILIDGKSTMDNKVGYTFRVNLEKQVNKYLFLITGLNYIQKQVDPMVSSYSIYKDQLKTGYLTLPLELGINLLPANKPVSVAFIAGLHTNFRITDKSESGPDRVGFSTACISETICAGLRLSLYQARNSRFFFQYSYNQDITNTYTETLYWSSAEPNKKFIYKYRTHIFGIGIQWVL